MQIGILQIGIDSALQYKLTEWILGDFSFIFKIRLKHVHHDT
jgi:hypothetical protein